MFFFAPPRVEAGALKDSDNVLFTLARPEKVPVKKAPIKGLRAARKAGVTASGGHLYFSLEGSAYSAAAWLIPIAADIRATCRLQLSVETRNAASLDSRPTVSVILERKLSKPDRAGSKQADSVKQKRVIPVFSVKGREDSEFTTIMFSLGDGGWRLRGVRVELALREEGTAICTLSRLRLTFAGNLPGTAAVTRVLQRPLPVRSTLEFAARRNPFPQVNHKRIFGPFFAASSGDPAFYRRLRDSAGVQVVQVTVNLGGTASGLPVPVWTYPDYLDRNRLDAIFHPVCGRDVKVMVNVMLATPPDWWPETPVPPSDLDPAWQRYRVRALRLLLAFLRDNPRYAASVIGCTPVLGQKDNLPGPGRERDPAYLAGFRRWLAQQYADDQALQRAWQDPAVRREKAEPLPMEKWRGAFFGLIHPAIQQRLLDSAQFYGESWADSLLQAAAVIQKASDRRLFCALLDGPARQLRKVTGGGPRPDWAAALERLLPSPDFQLVTISCRNAEDAERVAAVADLLRSRQKALVLRAAFPVAAASLRHRAGLRRLFGAALCRGAEVLLVAPPDAPWPDVPDLKLLRTFNRINRRAARLPDKLRPGIALVCDPLARLLPPDGDGENWCPSPPSAWFRLGAPVELVSFDHGGRAVRQGRGKTGKDDGDGKALSVPVADGTGWKRFRVLFFHHVFRLDPSRSAFIQQLMSGGRVLAWFWADGLRYGPALSPLGLERASGIPLRLGPPASFSFLQPTSALAEFLDLPETQPLPRVAAPRAGPRFFVTADKGVVLARWPDGKAAMTLTAEDDFSCFYCASPRCSPDILRAVAAESDLPFFLSAGNPAAFGRSLIMVHPMHDGIVRLHLPKKSALYAVFRQQEIPAALAYQLELQGGRTYLFFLGSRNKWLHTGTGD